MVGDDGRVRVVDFGLAHGRGMVRTASPDADALPPSDVAAPTVPALEAPLTEAGTFLGTPPYVAPEQLAQAPTDARTDQFAFCVTLYEALYGTRPFAGSTVEEVQKSMAMGLPARPPLAKGVPVHVHTSLRRGLALDPATRHP